MNAKTVRKRRRIRRTINWAQMEANHLVQPCAHSWVTDESIKESLKDFVFDDPRVAHHEGTHRANRIASIVRMMNAGVVFDPIAINVCTDGVHIADGHHRLRAYQFRKRLGAISVAVAGKWSLVRDHFLFEESQKEA